MDSVDIEIPRPCVAGFLGPNGAGKSTTIRMICGVLAPTSGSVHVAGCDIARDPLAARRAMGYLPESAPVHPELRVTEYLDFRGRLFGLARAARRLAIDRAIEDCGLVDVRRRLIGQLSKGYRQRVGVAAAILHDPAVVVLDEPTVGLDPSQIQQFRALLKRLGETRTVLISTHILPEVEATCDRVVMIARGRIQLSETLEALQRDVRRGASITAEVRGDTAAIEQTRTKLTALPGVVDVHSQPLAGDWQRITLRCADDVNDLRESVGRSFASAGLVLRELHSAAGTLEQRFLDVVRRADADAAAEAAESAASAEPAGTAA